MNGSYRRNWSRQHLLACAAFVLFGSWTGIVRADAVTAWNDKFAALMEAERQNSGIAIARNLAIMNTAMFEAINAVEKRYTKYLPLALEGAGASPVAAAHAAARRTLNELLPKHKLAIDAMYDAGIATAPDGPAKTAGITLGEIAATAMLENRKADGANGPNTYRPATTPGVYVPTALPVVSHVATIKPFALKSVSQFRPGPPPEITSALFARDYNETREWGATKSVKRTPWQTETGEFWVLTGSTAWNQATRGLAAQKPMTLVDNARLFTLVNMALYDGLLAIFDAKYQYGFWRPITAIRNGDRDGNDATERDAGWTPLIDTPMHPEFPCAHCVADGAGGAVLKSVFGAGVVPDFILTYFAMPGVVRKYTSIDQLEDEVAMARIWGGIHFRTSNEVGGALGVKVGEYVLQNYLRPVR